MGKADVGSFEPQANIGLNITVENKEIYNFANTLKEIAKGKDLQRYWKDVESSVDNATKAIERFNKRKNSSGSSNTASELIKQINSLKAMTNNKDLSKLFPSVNLDELLNAAKKITPEINKEFSVENFSNAFKTFNALKEKGIELNQVFSSLADYRKQLDKAFKLSLENSELKSIIGNNDIEKIKQYYKEIESYRVKSKELFSSFLTSNNIPEGAYLDGYFQNIVDGTLTAQEAINKFKIEYSSIFEGTTNNDVGLEQIQMFSEKMSSLYTQVEAVHQKINDIISNGVTAKSVENLNSESQRSLFGNLIQDEENLKTITTIIQNLIAEQNNVKNNNFVNQEQFELLESYFKKIDSYLSSIKSVLVDVGNGEELSPLLKTITKVESAINNLSSSVKNIGLNMNIDIGSDKEMEAKAQAKIANALQAYQRLFDHLKVTAPAGEIIGQKFFDFDISQYDTTRGKLEAYVKFIKDIRNEAKSYFNGQDVLYTGSDKKYWTQASSAAGQVTKVFNEIKAASNTNPLENLFGKTDLTPIISQLENIAVKLDEISVSTTRFSETFSQGVNVTTSVEEVSRLTEKVKELEVELAKVKITPATLPTETNILSAPTFAVQQQDELQEGLKRTELQAVKTEQALKEAIISTASTESMKDAFQGSSTKAEASANAINKENEALKQTANTATEAATAKEKFTKANSKVKESADASVGSVNQEAEALANAGKSATNGLNNINEFRPNTTGFDELISKLKITEEEAKRIESIIVNSNYSVAAKKTLDSYNVRYKNGDSRVIGENSQTDRGNTLGSREILYNDKQIQQLDTIREKIKALKKDCFSEKNGRAGTQYGLGEQFNDAVEKVDKLTAAFNEGKLSLSTYKKNIDSVINSYNRLVTIQQNRDMDRVNSNQKAVTAALREQLTAYKNICSVREKLAGIKNKDGSQDEVIRALNKEKELYLNNFKIASSFLKNNKLYFDSILQVNKLLEQQLKSKTKIAAKRASINKSNDTTSSSKVNVNTINEANRRINSLNNSLNELKNTNGFRKVKSDFDEIFNSRTNFSSLEKYRNAIDQLRKLLSEAKKINTETNSALNRVNNQFTNLSSSDILKSTFSKQLAESSLVIEKLNADFKNGTISIDEYNTKTRQTLSNLAELKRLGNGQILGSVNSVTTIDAAKQQVLNYASQNSKKISKPINVSAPDSNGIRTITTEIITQENEIQKLTAKWSAATNTVSLSTKTMGTEVSATTKVIQGFVNKWKQLAQYMTAMYLNPYMLIYRIRDMITTVSELDYELMDLRKTADMSTSELHEFYLESNNVAKEMGVSTKEILSQASAWSRLGYNTKQTATEMAKLSSQFATISPGMEVDEATTGLVSVMKAFDITTDEVKSEIMDKINIVGNNFATNNQEIIEGLQRMASAMASTGADLEDTIALFTAGQEVVQDAEQVGSAIKSFSMRIRGMEETGEYLDELKDIKGDVYELTNGKVHIMEDENTYRPVLDILRDISEVWSEITDKNRAKLLEKLFAKTRANVGAAVLQNFQQAEKSLEVMENSAGSSDKEMSIAQDTLDYKINKLKGTWTGFLQEIADQKTTGGVIDFFTAVSDVITNIVSSLGLLKTTIISVFAVIAAKNNLGRANYISSPSYCLNVSRV